MKKFPYYPGCTLKQTAKNFGDSAVAAAKAVDIELVEIPRWNCCGAVSSLTADDLMHHVAPTRNLVRVQEMNQEGMVDNEYDLIVFCSMCFNVLKRSNERVKNDPEMLKTINNFMDTEQDYEVKVNVVHFLDKLRDIGWDKVKSSVKKPLKGMKVSAYYGCTLLRPRGIGIDDPEAPTIMDDFIEAMGAEPVNNPYKSLCCGSYHTVGDNKELVADRAYKIINAARENGAEMIITSCPLCAFNLDNRQKETKEKYPDFEHMPVIYFTQIMALAMGMEDKAGFDGNYIDATPLLKKHGFLEG